LGPQITRTITRTMISSVGPMLLNTILILYVTPCEG
jgi:hypothetical protein